MPPLPSIDDRSPLWRLFLCLIAGIVLAEYPGPMMPALTLGTFLLAFLHRHCPGRILIGANHSSRRGEWQKNLFGVLLGILMSALYAQWRSPPPLEAGDFQEGWHTLDLRLQRTYSRRRQTQQVYGQGMLVDSPTLPPSFRGQRLYFMLYENSFRGRYRGQVLRVRAHLRRIRGTYEAHSFEAYLQKVRIPLQIDRGEIQKTLREGPAFFRLCHRLQQKARQLLRHPTQDTGVLRCMLLNDRGDVQRPQKKLFARTGVAHLLAISGLHIGMIGLMLEGFLRLFGCSKRQRRIPCILLLGLYTWVIGAPPSAVRAFLMLGYCWSACFFSRRPSALSAVSFAGVLSLLPNPQQLWDLGLRFSYTAILCILLIGSPLASGVARRLRSTTLGQKSRRSLWSRCSRPLLSYVLQSFCISASISILTIPLSIEYFGSFSLSGIFINLIAVPLSFLLIAGGFGTLMAGFFLNGRMAPWLLEHFLGPCGHCFERFLHYSDTHLPGAWEDQNLRPGTGTVLLLLVTALSLGWHRFRRKRFCRQQIYRIAAGA